MQMTLSWTIKNKIKFNIGVLDSYIKKLIFSVFFYFFQIRTQHVNIYEAYTLINYHLSS